MGGGQDMETLTTKKRNMIQLQDHPYRKGSCKWYETIEENQ